MKKTPSKKPTSRKPKTVLPDQTDWKRIDAMTDDDIDFSDNPEATPEMFARAVLRSGIRFGQHWCLQLKYLHDDSST
jgi:hypothetical protein